MIKSDKSLFQIQVFSTDKNFRCFYSKGVDFVNNTEELQKLVDRSSRIVFFGGAGVSTESGIPDFRSVDGLYNQKYD